MKKHGFAGGAVILGVSIALGKILSAVFKIPLDRFLLHAEGMGIFNGAYNIYVFFFTLATAGLPLALSKLIASSGTESERNGYLSTAFAFTSALLWTSSAFIFIFAPSIACHISLPGCAQSLRVMAVGLLPLSVTASLRGYFQGGVYMVPSALSQLADSFGRLAAGLTAAMLFIHLSYPTLSAAAMVGVPCGAFLSAGILIFFFVRGGGGFHLSFSFHKLCELIKAAAPVTLTSSAYPFFNLIDTLSVVPLLSSLNPTEEFGCLTRASTLYALPVSLTSAIAASVLPSIASAVRRGDMASCNKDSSFAIRLTFLISMPCAAGLAVLSAPVLELLYNSRELSVLVAIAAPSAFLASFSGVLAAMLQGFGKISSSAVAMLFTLAAKLMLNIILIKCCGISGAAWATTLSYLILTAALFIMLIKFTHLRFSFAKLFLKPLCAALCCGAAAALCVRFMSVVTSVAVAALVYIIIIFATRFITPGELLKG